MADDMFFSAGGKTLRKGRRVARRTSVNRRAEFWRVDDKDGVLQGQIKDLNQYGMLLEADRGLPVGTVLSIELKRDELFVSSLSCVKGKVVRVVDTGTGRWQMGLQLILAKPKPPPKPIRIEPKKSTLPKRKPTRMYTLDVLLGGEE